MSILSAASALKAARGRGLAKKVRLCYDIGMLTKRKKENVIKEVAIHDADTGSAEVQIAVLSKRIDELASHLKKHLKDKHSRRGLLQMVANRRKHLKYLETTSKKRYGAIVKKLGLKK